MTVEYRSSTTDEGSVDGWSTLLLSTRPLFLPEKLFLSFSGRGSRSGPRRVTGRDGPYPSGVSGPPTIYLLNRRTMAFFYFLPVPPRDSFGYLSLTTFRV